MIRPLLYLPLAALLASGTAAIAEEKSLESRVKKLHALAGGEVCQPLEEAGNAEDAYQSWTFKYPASWSSDGEEEEMTLIQIWCASGAYNLTHMFYTYREAEGLMPLSFATPDFKTTYENDDSQGKLEDVTVTGMSSTTALTNAAFDEKTRTISEFALWRGIGDASSSGAWIFKDGVWILQRYDVDASFDGENNPETVVNYAE